MRVERINNCTLYLGDCRAILQSIDLPQDIGCVFDPPYGYGHKSKTGVHAVCGAAPWQGAEILNDKDTSVRDWVVNWWASRGPMACFASWKRPLDSKLARARLTWCKGPQCGQGDFRLPWKDSCEDIFIIGAPWKGRRDESDIRGPAQVTWASKGRQHPHQKPGWLARYLMERMPVSTIIDPCAGSGWSGVEAIKLGRSWIGCEADQTYFDIALNNLRAAQRQPGLFEMSPLRASDKD
ncbi:MAG: hypothetical protein HQL42_13260 [Alphaproteobacteria bacterium]|nr:hypothetical protein [Alphaproteobacteria bacterium]